MLHNVAVPDTSINIAIFDACRDTGGIQAASLPPLLPVQAPPNTLFAFSTSPGAKASSNALAGELSVYTKHLVRELQQVNIPLESLFKNVRRAVYAETQQVQLPWEHSSLTQEVYLLPGVPINQSTANSGPSPSATQSVQLEYLASVLPSAAEGNRGALELARRILGRLIDAGDFTDHEIAAIAVDVKEIGATFADLESYAIDILALPFAKGAVVTSVKAGSRASEVLREGDIVVEVNEKPVTGLASLRDHAASWVQVGVPLTVKVFRNGTVKKVSAAAGRASPAALALSAAAWNMVQKKYARAQQLATWAADNGFSDANVLLANLAANGLGSRTSPDPAEAMSRAQMAVDGGSLRGKFWLMQGYLRGWHVSPSVKRANELRNEAASEGAPWAIAGLGIAYVEGQGVAVDYEKAFPYLRLAAALAQPDALVVLGYLHERGLGVPKDALEAERWYDRSIKTGNLDAMRIAQRALARLRVGAGSFAN